jgi:transcriptional regulator
MYTPPHNREPDRAKIIAFMQAYPFATLVTTRADKISATHLPVLIDERGDEVFICAHLARANAQWHDFENDAPTRSDALVIFQEPHAFISTRHYERAFSVPTWNYVAVHAYGTPRMLESLGDRLAIVERTVARFEGNLEQWNALPHDFRVAKANGIVAFELCVTRLDARFKLSQDRSTIEQARIVESLTHSAASVETTIGEMMQARLNLAT